MYSEIGKINHLLSKFLEIENLKYMMMAYLTMKYLRILFGLQSDSKSAFRFCTRLYLCRSLFAKS